MNARYICCLTTVDVYTREVAVPPSKNLTQISTKIELWRGTGLEKEEGTGKVVPFYSISPVWDRWW
jgi:hypothetical protein